MVINGIPSTLPINNLNHLRIVQILQFWCRLHMSSYQGCDQRHWLLGCWILTSPWFCWKTTSPTLQTISSHHLFDHSHCQTLLEATKLTSISPPFVHRAIFIRQADVFCILLDGSLEETLATLASSDPIVLTRCMVSANCTQETCSRPS